MNIYILCVGDAMRIGMIGLGRMGMNMARRLLQHDIEVVGFNRSSDKTDQLKEEGGLGAYSFEELKEALEPPRTVWVMLPAGKATEMAIAGMKELLDKGDTIIEGGNSYYKDDIKNAEGQIGRASCRERWFRAV